MSGALDFLFPTPSLPKSVLSPSPSPEISPEATEALQKVLRDNHVRWHIFYNEKRFHNHAAHRALAAWALGAEPSTITSGYEKECRHQKPAIKSPEPITVTNFDNHLGDERYYVGYVQFFIDQVKEHGVAHTLERFVLSPEANIGTGSKQPWMLSRFLSEVVHAMIHTGYGAEFDMPGLVVEGLATTAVQRCPDDLLAHLSLFERPGDTLYQFAHNDSETIQHTLGTTAGAVNKALPSNLRLGTSDGPGSTVESTPRASSSALSILSRVLNDAHFRRSQADKDSENPFYDTVKTHGKALSAFTNQWEVNPSTIDAHIEDLVWTVCVLYGAAGWTDAHDTPQRFNADFYLMHLVTSSLFLPALCALLAPASQVRLLKAYFHIVLLWAVARGQPALDLRGFAHATQPPVQEGVPESVMAMKRLDLWMRAIEAARMHQDEHVTKIIRALGAWAAAFGARKACVRLGDDDSGQDVPGAKSGAGFGISHDEAESAGLGMGLGSENELGVSRDTGGDKATRRASTQIKDVDLNPRAWRDFKNSGDEDFVGFHPCSKAASISTVGAGGVRPAPLSASGFGVAGTEVSETEFDGGLFLGIAVLTLDRLGWDKDVRQRKDDTDEDEFWDFQGFYDKGSRNGGDGLGKQHGIQIPKASL